MGELLLLFVLQTEAHSAVLVLAAGRGDASSGEEQLTAGTNAHLKHVVHSLRIT